MTANQNAKGVDASFRTNILQVDLIQPDQILPRLLSLNVTQHWTKRHIMDWAKTRGYVEIFDGVSVFFVYNINDLTLPETGVMTIAEYLAENGIDLNTELDEVGRK